ncbi:hypothetical protein D3C71_1818100 [compost metagenome]
MLHRIDISQLDAVFLAKTYDSGSKPGITVFSHIDFCSLAQLDRLNGLLGADLDLSVS